MILRCPYLKLFSGKKPKTLMAPVIKKYINIKDTLKLLKVDYELYIDLIKKLVIGYIQNGDRRTVKWRHYACKYLLDSFLLTIVARTVQMLVQVGRRIRHLLHFQTFFRWTL